MSGRPFPACAVPCLHRPCSGCAYLRLHHSLALGWIRSSARACGAAASRRRGSSRERSSRSWFCSPGGSLRTCPRRGGGLFARALIAFVVAFAWGFAPRASLFVRALIARWLGRLG